MRVFAKARLAPTLAFALAGCGLVSGLDNLGVSDASVDATLDAGVDGEPAEVLVDDSSLDVGPSCEAGTCGAPSGFEPVFFAADQSTDCANALDVVSDPAVPAGACTCTCIASDTCVPQVLSYSGGGNQCSQAGALGVVDGGCEQGSQQKSAPTKIAFPTMPLSDASTCANTLAQGSPTSTPARVCPLATCSACTAPKGYSLCFAAAGDVPCSEGMTRHVVAETATVSCGACSACSPTGACGGTVHISDDMFCGNTIDQTINVNGSCVTTEFDIFGSYQYNWSLLDAGCTAGTSTGALKLKAETTICCP